MRRRSQREEADRAGLGRGHRGVWPVGGGGAGGEESKKGGAWKTKVGPVGVQGKLERGRKVWV